MYTINCSDEFWECRASTWIWKVIPFILLFVGTIGNIFNVLVFTRRNLRRLSASLYMLILATSDTLTLWTVLLESTLKYGYSLPVIDLTSFQCKTAAWAAYSFGGFSTWTIANLTIERVILTKFPIWGKIHIRPKVAIITSTITFFVIQCVTTHLLYGHKLITYTPPVSNGTYGAATTVTICYMVTPEYGRFFATTWNQIVLFAFNVIPTGVIITGNSIIGISLVSQRRRIRHELTINQPNAKRENSTIKTVLVIAVFFVVCTTPYCIFFVLYDYSLYDPSSHKAAIDKLILTVVCMLLFINYTFNFYLYVLGASTFRKEWKQMVNEWKVKFTRCFGTCRIETNRVRPLQSVTPAQCTTSTAVTAQTPQQIKY